MNICSIASLLPCRAEEVKTGWTVGSGRRRRRRMKQFDKTGPEAEHRERRRPKETKRWLERIDRWISESITQKSGRQNVAVVVVLDGALCDGQIVADCLVRRPRENHCQVKTNSNVRRAENANRETSDRNGEKKKAKVERWDTCVRSVRDRAPEWRSAASGRHSLLYAALSRLLQTAATAGGGWEGKGVVDSRPHRAPHLAFRVKREEMSW